MERPNKIKLFYAYILNLFLKNFPCKLN